MASPFTGKMGRVLPGAGLAGSTASSVCPARSVLTVTASPNSSISPALLHSRVCESQTLSQIGLCARRACHRRRGQRPTLSSQALGGSESLLNSDFTTSQTTLNLIMEQAHNHLDGHATSGIVSQLAGVFAGEC